jgi:(2Fe-2S) ferredoxin
MIIYDDKADGIIESGSRFILPKFEPCDEATFKASYIVTSKVECEGKITALFDLVVLGDVKAKELDVKGRFTCLGTCEVGGSIVVQNEIWANDLRAVNIESHDRIVAQEIDGGTIVADGSIVVGKILAVEKLAKSEKNILCGETAYGAGKVAANTIITGEPLDLDDGEDAIVSPNSYQPVAEKTLSTPSGFTSTETVDLIAYGESEFALQNDFIGYLDFLISIIHDDVNTAKFAHWKEVISEAESVRQSGINEYTNVALVIWLAEVALSPYFKNWEKVREHFKAFESHFKCLIERDKNVVGCDIETYSVWLDALATLNRFGASIDMAVYGASFELVVSNLGLKSKFVYERLNDKGWEAYAE